MSDLPTHWISTTIGDVFDVVGGGTPSTSIANYWAGDIPWISSADISEEGTASPRRFITQEAIEQSAACMVPEGSVIVVTRVGLGKVALAHAGISFSQDSQALLPRAGIRPEFLRLQLSQVARQLKHVSRGTTIAGVTKKQLLDLPLALAPTAEQERIVAAIEEQFSRLDAGVAALERVRQNLKRMRAAVLQAATDDAVLRSPQGSVQLLDLLTTPLANGRSVPDGPMDGFPVLRLTAVRGGWIDTRQVKAGSWTAREAAPFTIKAGDFLIVRGNGSKHLVGRGGLVFTSANVAYPDTLIRARLNTGRAIPAFVALLWDSGGVRKQIESAARTTAGIYKINQQSLGQVCLPIPALEDQERILGVAEKHLSMLTSAEATITSATTHAHQLRSSILAAAFSGKLVPQDPTDEPASVLLERIAAEQESTKRRKA